MILNMADVPSFVADGIATGSTVYCILFYLFYIVSHFCFVFVYLFLFILFHFILSSEKLNRTSSHM